MRISMVISITSTHYRNYLLRNIFCSFSRLSDTILFLRLVASGCFSMNFVCKLKSIIVTDYVIPETVRWDNKDYSIKLFLRFQCNIMHMRHSSPNHQPSRDLYHLWFYFSRNTLKGAQKKYGTRSFRFLKKNFAVNFDQNNSKNWRWHCWTLSSWTKFWLYILCEKTNFLCHGQKWARLWFGSCEKITIKKP